MFRLYSKGCEYAIRALTHLAPKNGKQKFLAKDVCKKAGIPEFFTRKTFQALVKGGFLKATPGPGGGYQLMSAPKDISLLSIIKAVDGKESFDQCVLGLPKCDDTQPCSLHHTWLGVKGKLCSDLQAKTLQDLIDIIEHRKRSKSRRK